MNYPNPFIIERADPYIVKGPDDYYYFTASYPAFESVENGYDRIILRRSKTVVGLAEAEEHIIWEAHKSGDMSAHIWAPELHYINGNWYVLFAGGNIDDVWDIRPYMLRCKGQNPLTDGFEELGRVQACEGDDMSFDAFSLDMTWFEHNSEHYVLWAEKRRDSVIMMAKINPDEPNKLICKPVLLTKPDYDWEVVNERVNEGPSVLKHNDKLIVFFSASGTGAEYCIGMLWAYLDSDLMNPASWHKSDKPILSTEKLIGEVGPGHNSFVVDEEGSLLLVYHSRPESHLKGECGSYCSEPLYDPCRHARIMKLEFDENGLPKL